MADLPSVEEWMAHANDVITISLNKPSKSGLKNIATFNPKFTHSIFGEEEQIFGYKGLKISLRYRANDMRPHLQVSSSKKFKALGGNTEPTDIVGILEQGNHLPKVAFAKASDFEDSSKQIGHLWTPPGTLYTTIDSSDGQYEIWGGSLTDPAIRQLHSRVQIFVPLFIDGGSYIGQDPESDSSELDYSDADRWTVFFLFKREPKSADPEAGESSVTFAGFATVYRFYYFQAPTPPTSPRSDEWELPKGDFDLTELPCRTRLSQFVILPPFQGKGNGARLYKTIFEHYHKSPQTHDFTVENPNEEFDDLRDVCDMAFLRSLPEFSALRINTDIQIPKTGPVPQLIVGGENLEKIRLKAKIAPRQFYRVLDMYLMSQLAASVQPSMELDDHAPAPTKADQHQEKLWQLVVKQRLYRHNRDTLSQIEPAERVDVLQSTLNGVALEYARILAAYERSLKHTKTPTARNGKHRMEEEVPEGSKKKARVEDA